MENLNSVCYVTTINEITPIEGADNIELVIANGWNCISKKGEYKVNDLVIIATTDAVIPQDLSDEMNVTNYLRKGQRVRTVKLRGVYSECLIIPTKYLVGRTKIIKDLKEGDDMMETLNIFKYEPEAKQIQLSSGKKIKYRENSNFHVYYKFPNIKNVKNMFNSEDIVEITRKIHGTNARFGFVKKQKLSFWDKITKFFGFADKFVEYEFVYGSHNVEKGSDSQGYYSTDVWKTIADDNNIKHSIISYVRENCTPDDLGSGFILYGEIYGPGIQKNFDYLEKELQFAGFDISVNGQYLNPSMSFDLITNELMLNYVPVLYFGAWAQEIQDKFVFKNFIDGTKIPHEGIVIKHITGDRRKVAKVINPDYLIASEKNDFGDSH